jgi:hypothetical protein
MSIMQAVVCASLGCIASAPTSRRQWSQTKLTSTFAHAHICVHTCMCQACLDHVFEGKRASCLVNPRAGHEKELVIAPGRDKIHIFGVAIITNPLWWLIISKNAVYNVSSNDSLLLLLCVLLHTQSRGRPRGRTWRWWGPVPPAWPSPLRLQVINNRAAPIHAYMLTCNYVYVLLTCILYLGFSMSCPFLVACLGRGHKVTLFEKDSIIGGQFNMAKVPCITTHIYDVHAHAVGLHVAVVV